MTLLNCPAYSSNPYHANHLFIKQTNVAENSALTSTIAFWSLPKSAQQ